MTNRSKASIGLFSVFVCGQAVMVFKQYKDGIAQSQVAPLVFSLIAGALMIVLVFGGVWVSVRAVLVKVKRVSGVTMAFPVRGTDALNEGFFELDMQHMGTPWYRTVAVRNGALEFWSGPRTPRVDGMIRTHQLASVSVERRHKAPVLVVTVLNSGAPIDIELHVIGEVSGRTSFWSLRTMRPADLQQLATQLARSVKLELPDQL